MLYVPAALALHQRPGVPGMRCTFGTMTELLNSLRLMFSRLASHRARKRPLRAAHPERGRRAADLLPNAARTCVRRARRSLAFNSGGRLPDLRRHRHRARGGPCHACA